MGLSGVFRRIEAARLGQLVNKCWAFKTTNAVADVARTDTPNITKTATSNLKELSGCCQMSSTYAIHVSISPLGELEAQVFDLREC